MCSFLSIFSIVTRKPIIPPPRDLCSTCHAVLITVELLTAKLREAFLFEVLNSFGIFLITFAILKNPFANPLKKAANLLMEFAMFLS